jgi:hypothetical protein
MTETSSYNLEAASATTTGVVNLVAQSLGAGNKYFSNNVGIATTNPTARLHIAAGTAAVGMAPIKFTAGTLQTTAEAGTIEYVSGTFYIRSGEKLSVAYFHPVTDSTAAFSFLKADRSTTVLGIDTTNGRVGVGVAAPTATIHLKAGTNAASTAPIKFTSGVVLGTPEAGTMEFDGTDYFLSI